jgi:hypothetical protein
MPRIPRLLIWTFLVLLLLPGQLAWLLLLRNPDPFAPPAILIRGQFLLGAACLAMLALLRTTPPDAVRLTARASVMAVVCGTLVLQLAATVLPAPGPRETAGAPVSQAVVGTTRLLADHLPRASGDVVLRATLAACAVAGVAVLAVALRRAGESPWHAALLGWNPLLTLAVGGTGDADALGVALLAAALAAAAAHRFKLAGAAMALACGVRPHALLLLPFLWRQVHEQRSFRAGRRVVLVFLATLAVVLGPALLGRHSAADPFAYLPHFGGAGEGDALIHESFKAVFGDPAGDAGDRRTQAATDAARLVGLLVVLGMGMLLWQSRASVAEAGYWLFTFGLLFAPAVGPGALMWVLVFVPLVRGPQGFSGLTWSATAAMGWAAWRAGASSSGAVPPAWLVAEYLPVFCVLAVEVLRLARVVPLGRAVQGPAATGGA